MIKCLRSISIRYPSLYLLIWFVFIFHFWFAIMEVKTKCSGKLWWIKAVISGWHNAAKWKKKNAKQPVPLEAWPCTVCWLGYPQCCTYNWQTACYTNIVNLIIIIAANLIIVSSVAVICCHHKQIVREWFHVVPKSMTSFSQYFPLMMQLPLLLPHNSHSYYVRLANDKKMQLINNNNSNSNSSKL